MVGLGAALGRKLRNQSGNSSAEVGATALSACGIGAAVLLVGSTGASSSGSSSGSDSARSTSRAPHFAHWTRSGGFKSPHIWQRNFALLRSVPHSLQNLLLSRLAVLHLGQ